MENNNINTNVAQIILPPDMELRKVKKKKPKKSLEKKKALNQLKETLKSYDTVLSLASSKKINLPAELGLLPDNLADINSVKELKQLTATLQGRIQTINQLIAQGAQKQRTTGLFTEGAPTRDPRIPLGSAPYQPPQRQPEILPNGGILPSPAPPIIPSGTGGIDPTQVPDGQAAKTLEELRKEILSKLSPEDKKKAEDELLKEQQEAQQQPQTPADPNVPDAPTTPTGSGDKEPLAPDVGFQIDKGFDIGGGKKIDLKSPTGFTDIYRKYRIYIEGLTGKVIKIDKGIIELPLLEQQELEKTRNSIVEEHDRWLTKLSPSQQKFMDSDPNLAALDKGMLKELTLDPIAVIKEIAKAQGIKIDQITSGVTKAEAEATKDSKAKEFLEKIKNAEAEFVNIVRAVNSVPEWKKDQVIFKQIQDLQEIKQNIEKTYDELQGNEKVSVENEYQQFRLKATNLSSNINRMEYEKGDKIDNDGNLIDNTGKVVVPIVPDVQPVEPQSPPVVVPAGTAGSRLRTGKVLKLKVSQSMKKTLGNLDIFSSNLKSKFTKDRYNEITEVMMDDKLESLINRDILRNGINDLPPATADRAKKARKLVKEQIIDRLVVQVDAA